MHTHTRIIHKLCFGENITNPHIHEDILTRLKTSVGYQQIPHIRRDYFNDARLGSATLTTGRGDDK
jgi:hypothetical protein